MTTEIPLLSDARPHGMSPLRLAGIVAGIAVLGLIAMYWSTAQSVEAIWRRSDTFAHGYLVIPIALWLIWRDRDGLAHLPVRPFWPALALVMLAGFGWLLGHLAGVLVLEQFALLGMAIGAVIAIVGLPITRQIAFPLAILVFAVPFGEFLVPTLIDRTADATIAALRMSGIPVYREGNHFAIPTGRWSVVEACSGIRYLIASAMVGTLYAYLTYRSTKKRLIFIVVSLVVPIFANWGRAYMIVMLGHLSGNKIATGVDHLIYGWIFFGAVILIMFWIGSFWREDNAPAEKPTGDRTAGSTLSHTQTRAVAIALVLGLALGMAWRPLGAALDARAQPQTSPLPEILASSDWTPASEPNPVWVPHYVGARTVRHQWFAKDGRQVGVYIALYSGQTQGNELITSQNLLVLPENHQWSVVAQGRGSTQWSGDEIAVRTAGISSGDVRLAAMSWYWVDGRFTSSDAVAKALLGLAKITLRPDHSAVIVIYTPVTGRPAEAKATLDQFSRSMGAAVMAALRRATGD